MFCLALYLFCSGVEVDNMANFETYFSWTSAIFCDCHCRWLLLMTAIVCRPDEYLMTCPVNKSACVPSDKTRQQFCNVSLKPFLNNALKLHNKIRQHILTNCSRGAVRTRSKYINNAKSNTARSWVYITYIKGYTHGRNINCFLSDFQVNLPCLWRQAFV